jgi:hypothetical protein
MNSRLVQSTTGSKHLPTGWVVGTLILASFALGSSAQVASPQDAQLSNAAVEQHVRGLIESLPSGSRTRWYMQEGARGDGIHYSWMDTMQRLGVRRVDVRTTFVGRGKPKNVKVTKVVYFSKYDHNCSQINDVERLALIRASGLPEQLGQAAIEHTVKAHWLLMDGRRSRHGVGIVHLLDDEWVPHLDSLGPAPRTLNEFDVAVDMDDVAGAMALLGDGVSKEERDSGLWASLGMDDPCMTSALLKAGSSPNLRDKFGDTLLMGAVLMGALSNAKVLLAADADVNAKAINGETALSIAKRNHLHHLQPMIELLTNAGARE